MKQAQKKPSVDETQSLTGSVMIRENQKWLLYDLILHWLLLTARDFPAATQG